MEDMVIELVIGIVRAVVKNPAKAKALQTVLTTLANDIYTAYGLTPPTQ
jgi:hypothetical protein